MNNFKLILSLSKPLINSSSVERIAEAFSLLVVCVA